MHAPDAPATTTPEPPQPVKQTFRQTFRDLGPAGPMAVVASTLPPLGSVLLLGSLTTIAPWLREHATEVLPLYVLAFAVLTGYAILPTYAVSILGGWVFGFRLGFPLTMTGFACATVLAYATARWLVGGRVVAMVDRNPKWSAVRTALVGQSFWRTLGIVILLRLPPTSPFALINLAAPSMHVPGLPYVLGTVIGMAPRTAIVLYTAARLERLTFQPGDTPIWLIVAGIVVTIVVLAALGTIANRAMAKITEGAANDE